jgi:hypothetical protein
MEMEQPDTAKAASALKLLMRSPGHAGRAGRSLML